MQDITVQHLAIKKIRHENDYFSKNVLTKTGVENF
jgi:hypothetical protein